MKIILSKIWIYKKYNIKYAYLWKELSSFLIMMMINIIKVCRPHGFLWISPLVSLLNRTQCPHRADQYNSLLVGYHWRVCELEFIREHRLWVCSSFLGIFQHVFPILDELCGGRNWPYNSCVVKVLIPGFVQSSTQRRCITILVFLQTPVQPYSSYVMDAARKNSFYFIREIWFPDGWWPFNCSTCLIFTSVLQGDTLALFLFIICLHYGLLHIKKNKPIH